MIGDDDQRSVGALPAPRDVAGLGAARGLETSVAVVQDESGVHFHFPVEIEVRGAEPVGDPEAHVHSALERLADHLGG